MTDRIAGRPRNVTPWTGRTGSIGQDVVPDRVAIRARSIELDVCGV